MQAQKLRMFPLQTQNILPHTLSLRAFMFFTTKGSRPRSSPEIRSVMISRILGRCETRMATRLETRQNSCIPILRPSVESLSLNSCIPQPLQKIAKQKTCTAKKVEDHKAQRFSPEVVMSIKQSEAQT